MAQTSRPWQSTSPGDAGPYSAANWQQLYQNIIGLGASRANEGVLLGTGTQPTDPLRVQAKSVPTTSIDVLAGSALVQGVAYINTATVSFVIAANGSGNPRIDTVVLQSDYALQTVRLVVKQGTPAASPSAPALTQSANVLWEIPLADIAVANGFVSITNANITPRQEWANAMEGVYLDSVLNNSGGILNTGDVVIWDASADRAVTTTTTAGSNLLAGVWVGRTANGGYGRVLVDGIGYVNGGAAITRGALLSASSVAKQAITQATTGGGGVLGRALETTSGAGFVLAAVRVRNNRSVIYVRVTDQKASGTAADSITSGGWRTRTLNTKDDPDGLVSLASSQMTLQPGTYMAFCTAQAPVNASGTASSSRLRLQNISDTTTLLQGNNNSHSASGQSTLSLMGAFTITAAKIIELQHYPNVTGNGGTAVTTGDNEIYAEVFLLRVGESTT